MAKGGNKGATNVAPKQETVSNEAAQEMIDKGEATAPAEAIVEQQQDSAMDLMAVSKKKKYESQMGSHKKFDKFKKGVIQP